MESKYKKAFEAASTAIGIASDLGIPTDLIFGGLFAEEADPQLAAIEAKIDELQASINEGFKNVTDAVFTTALTAASIPTLSALGTLRNSGAPASDRDGALDNAKDGLIGTAAAVTNVLSAPIDTISRDVLELAFESLSLSLSVLINTANAFNTGAVRESGSHNQGGVWRYESEINAGIAALELIEPAIRSKYSLETAFFDTEDIFVPTGPSFGAGFGHTIVQLKITHSFELDAATGELVNAGDKLIVEDYVEEFFGPGALIDLIGGVFHVNLPEQFNRFERTVTDFVDFTDTPLPSRFYDTSGGPSAALDDYQLRLNEMNGRDEDYLFHALTGFNVDSANIFALQRSFYETGAEGIGSLIKETEGTLAGVNKTAVGLVEGQVTEGTAFDDFLTGGTVGDVLRGLAGDDYLLGKNGDDLMQGGEGNDHYYGGKGNDTIQDDGAADDVDVAIFAGEIADKVFKIKGDTFSVVSLNPVNGAVVQTDVLTGIEFIRFDDVIAEIAGLNRDLIIEGTDAAETLIGRLKNDTLLGFGGNDVLVSAGDADRLEGGTGDDRYQVNNESDEVIEGVGAGIDTVFSSVANFTLGANVENLVLNLLPPGQFGDIPLQTGTGNELDNVLEGSDGSNALNGGAGNDILRGKGGTNTLNGGTGDDLLVGISGGIGSASASYADAVAGVNVDLRRTDAQNVGGGEGTDTLQNITGLNGSAHNDILRGNAEGNSMSGGGGNDVLRGFTGGDTFFGGAGNDKMFGGGGNDFFFGGTGDDVMTGGFGNDEFFDFEGGNERMLGGNGADRMSAGDGDDFLFGNNGKDQLFGERGKDDLRGGNKNDTLSGGADNDLLLGGRGKDILNGDAGNDRLLGGGGEDILNGGAGNDVLQGAGQGGGRFDGKQDTFVYRTTAQGEGGFDRIRNFENGIDLIDLRAFGFTDFDTQVATLASDKSKGLQIDFADGDVLFINGFLKADFDAGDVILS